MSGTIHDSAGDPVAAGDNGSFGRPTFGPSPERGVDIVKHHPNTEPMGADPLPADELIGAVKARLAQEHIDDSRLQIERDGRDLLLRGEVDSEEHRATAEILASGTPGVTAVKNELQVVAR